MLLFLLFTTLNSQASASTTKTLTPVSPALIQDSVVRACDQINNHNGCSLKKNVARAAVKPAAVTPPPPAAQPPPPPVVLSRCDPTRRDAPPATSLKNVNDVSMPMSSLDSDEANQIFQFVDKQKSRYVLGSNPAREVVCRERAHLIGFDLQDVCKVKSAKIFVTPGRSAWSLYLTHNSMSVEAKGEQHRWDTYHVANVIMVNKNGEDKPYVIDPVLFDRPVPMSEWKSLMNKNNSSLNYTVTSGSTYGVEDADSDKPQTQIIPGIAEQRISQAKAMYRKMNSP